MHRTTISACLLSLLLGTGAAAAAETPSSILITNVDVFDGLSQEVARGQDVLIVGNLIRRTPPADTGQA